MQVDHIRYKPKPGKVVTPFSLVSARRDYVSEADKTGETRIEQARTAVTENDEAGLLARRR